MPSPDLTLAGDMSAPDTLRVSNISTTRNGPTTRISADVGGDTLWFESDDIELGARAEVFASALLIPALESRLALSLDQPLSSTWLSNCRQLLRILNEWWGYAENVPVVPPGSPVESPAPLKTALCFTGGVDSFYSLLRSGQQIDFLINAHGFDVKLDDTIRLNATGASIREIAGATETTPVMIRTNLREHPLVASASWERSHGGGLAALGHLLSGAAARLLISSSHSFEDQRPWGSHWATDPLWSSSSMQILHFGAELRRGIKLQHMAREPLVRKHLHVCWENRAPLGNCSCCDKCLRTRLFLLECGELDNFATLKGTDTLIDDLNALPLCHSQMVVHRRIAASTKIDRKMHRALTDLINRTEAFRKRETVVPKQRGLLRILRRLTRGTS